MSEDRKCYVTKKGSIKGSALVDRVNCQMIRWMRRRLHRKKKKLPFIVVEQKMDKIDQANSQLDVDEEGRLLEIPKKALSEIEMCKLEADLKESCDQLKEAVLEREKEVEKKKAESEERELEAVLEQMDKLEADLKESVDRVKEVEKKADDKEPLPELREEELVAVMERKMTKDKEDCLEALKVAGGVEKKQGESLYKTLLGMIIKGSVDAILKREVIHLTAQMCRFRNNIATKLPADEEITDDSPLDLLKVPDGFENAWKVWKEQEGNKDREELSYKALRDHIMVIED